MALYLSLAFFFCPLTYFFFQPCTAFSCLPTTACITDTHLCHHLCLHVCSTCRRSSCTVSSPGCGDCSLFLHLRSPPSADFAQVWQRILAIFPGVLQPNGCQGSWVERRRSSSFPMYCGRGLNPNPKMCQVLFKMKEHSFIRKQWEPLTFCMGLACCVPLVHRQCRKVDYYEGAEGQGACCRFQSVRDSGINQQVMNPVRLAGSAQQWIQSC